MTGCRPRLGDEIVEPDVTKARRRAMVTAGTAVALVVSLIGGTLALLFSGGPQQSRTALKPLEPPVSVPAIEPAPVPSTDGQTDLSMFGFGNSSVSNMAAGDSSVSGMADTSGGVTQSGFTPSASAALPPLPTLQLPDAPALPALPAFDWNALLAPLVAAQANAQAANIAGSVVGGSVGIANSVAVVLGDLILFAAYTNNGQPLLTALQNTLAAPAAAAAAGTALVANMPPVPALPDLGGLAAAFAATVPPIGVPSLPAPPDLSGLAAALAAAGAVPPINLPTPDQVAAGLALPALAGLALPMIPPIGLPSIQLPPPPDLTPLLLLPLLGLLPSPTRLIGLPF
jgi:hypothetical protein